MSRSIGGVYSLPPGSAAVDNTIIDPVIYNALLSDLEADLNLPRPIVAGGTGAASADGALTALGGGTTGKAVFTAADVAAALVALGLTNAQVPPGQVGYFYRVAAPSGWLAASGQNVSRTTYASLWSAMGSPNTGDGSTTFTLPDMRGVFPRGLDSSRGVDPGRALGALQGASFVDHTHSATADTHAGHAHTVPSNADNLGINTGNGFAGIGGADLRLANSVTSTDGAHSHGITVGGASVGGGTETRPVNVALLACIKT